MTLFSKLYLYESEGEFGGSARFVGTFLRLYLDGCLTIIVSIRDFLCSLEIEFKCKY